MGILAALVERGRSGVGQVVDAAMIDGSAQLMSIFWGIDAMGGWGPRGTNLLDGGAHFYNVYETADGGYVSLAAYEPKFYANFLRLVGPLGFDDLDAARQMDMSTVARTQGTVGGAVPHEDARRMGRVLRRDRGVLRAGVGDVGGARASAQRGARDVRRRRWRARTRRPRPASAGPRPRSRARPVKPGTDTDTALAEWGFAGSEVATLKANGAIA